MGEFTGVILVPPVARRISSAKIWAPGPDVPPISFWGGVAVWMWSCWGIVVALWIVAPIVIVVTCLYICRASGTLVFGFAALTRAH